MYSITATRSTARISAARAGRRRRRNPLLVMRDGSAIKLAPGKSVTISEEAYLYNLNLINEFSDCLVIRNLNPDAPDRTEADTEPPQEVPPPVPEEDVQGEEVVTEAVTVQEEVQEVPTEKPKRRRRKSTKESDEKPVNEEEVPKKRRRSRKATS